MEKLRVNKENQQNNQGQLQYIFMVKNYIYTKKTHEIKCTKYYETN